jgi:hypothetical protein
MAEFKIDPVGGTMVFYTKSIDTSYSPSALTVDSVIEVEVTPA